MKRLTLALLLAAAAPAAAQTARIAHASHSGSPETLAADAAADNFGQLAPYFVADSARLLTDSTALEYGRWKSYRDEAKADERSRVVQFMSRRADASYGRDRTEYVRILRGRSWHPVKLVGDTVPPASKATELQPIPLPIKTKTKRKRQEAALTPLPAAPDGPTLPGGLLLAAGILLLTAAGWLLAAAPDKRPLAPA